MLGMFTYILQPHSIYIDVDIKSFMMKVKSEKIKREKDIKSSKNNL